MRRAVLAVAVLVLSGCATIPTAGPVLVGGPITVESRTEIEYLPAGPAEGATQREILDGFIAAGAAPQNNFRIARSFLTDAAALTWNPARETIVRGIYASVKVSAATELTYFTTIVSRVDENGVFSTSSRPESRDWQFGFTRTDGEWRLSVVPDLTVVSESTFASTYDEYIAYFYNHDRTAFVPDVRVFARQGDPVTSVARAVIAGPSQFLPNASTAFPPGSELTTAPVEREAGNTTVDVSDTVVEASIRDQQDMLAQLVASLGEITDVTSTVMSVNRVSLTIPTAPGIEPNPRVDDRPLILYDNSFGYSTDAEIESIPSNEARLVNLRPTSISYDASTNATAVGTRTGVFLLTDRTERVSDRESLVDPQIDGSRSVWWVDPTTPHQVSVSIGGGRIVLNGPWPRTAQIVGLEVAREGARVAIGVNDRGRGYVLVGAISVDESGRPTGVSGFRRLTIAADSIIDLAWADSTHVAVLGSRNGVIHAELGTVGGGSRLLGQPQNPARISGGNAGITGLVVIAGNGQLWKPRGAGWQSTGVPADVLATQR
ncbi:MAG: GerMN domain-containing protein [Microbacteriaceae bacterium]|nr:GerMN domain-containing protein [Microbacteriaceae bacterium]